MSIVVKITLGWIVLACVGTVVIMAVAGEPAGAFLWVLSPYVPLVILGVVAHMWRRIRLLALGATLCISCFGVLAMLDGHLLHAGWLVTKDIQVAHLVSIFAPMYQWMAVLACWAIALLILGVELLVAWIRFRRLLGATRKSAVGASDTDLPRG